MNGLRDEVYGELEGDFEGETFGDQEADFEADLEADLEGDFEADHEQYGEGEGPFHEEQELELAAELLSVSQEAELDHFLGKLFKRISPAVGQILGSPSGQSLKGLLGSAAKKALPLLGRAVGGYFGGAKGGDIGAQLGNLGGRIFGLELEGMSPEDRELEMAKRFVRLAGDAAVQVAQTAGRGGSPQQTARAALASAASRHAPGLLKPVVGAAGGIGGIGGIGSSGGVGVPRKRKGFWYRRGRNVVVVGI
ncbi:MAG TPA: hypothetical protein VGS57_21480 [Thermoanaerobaculia bacterium]|nr:hypothetical protein [Thermoanaerobaculia bacterium]